MPKKIKTPETDHTMDAVQYSLGLEKKMRIANRSFLAMAAKVDPLERQVADLTEELEISRAQNAGLLGYGRFHETLITAIIKALGVDGVAKILPEIRRLTRARKPE